MKGIKRMNKKLAAVLLVLTLLFLGACSKEEATYDFEKLTEDIQSKVAFEDGVSSVGGHVVESIYGIDPETLEETVVYKGSGATSEEFALFAFDTETNAEAAEALLEAYLSDQKTAYASYMPKEVARLEKAVLYRNGRYVFLCVSDEAEAFESLVK